MRKGWQTKKLGEVADVYDGPHATPKTVDTGPIFLGISALRDGVIDLNETRHVTEDDFRQWTRRVMPQPNDVVFSYETRLGQAAIIPEGLKCCLGRRMGLVRFNEDEVAPRFFLYQYLSPPFRDYLNSKTVRGATVDRISIREFPYFQIAVPPLSEQHRIVGILDEAFDGLTTATANAEKNLRNARALFESHLQSVFTQRGKGWEEKRICDACILRSGTTLAPELEKSSGEIPYLKVADMNLSANLNGITCSSRYVSKHDVNASNLLPVGTTIFPKRGGAILTNKKRLTTRIICADLNIMGVTPKQGLLPQFLFNYFLNLDLREINNGSSIPQINNYSIEPLVIVFPESVSEQQAIVEKVRSLSEETQRLESIYQQKIAALGELKKSLLHEAFSGRL